jgi:hypothetical protein
MTEEHRPGAWRLDVPQLPASGWAWEFARRNARLTEAWEATVACREQVGATGRAGFFELKADPHTASPWPFLFVSDPKDSPADVGTIWWPEHLPSTVHAIAMPLSEARDMGVFSLSDIPLPSIVLRTADGVQHVVIKDDVRSLQLAVRGASLEQPVGLLVDTALLTPAFPDRQMEALAGLRILLSTGELSKGHFPAHPRSERLGFYRAAFDGIAEGLSQKEIAVKLVGQETVDREWPNADGPLRARVRYAMLRSKQLVNHGYLALLR